MCVMWYLTSLRLETVLLSVQDRCIVCTKHVIGSEIVLDARDVPLGDETQLEALFGPFGHSANLDAR